MGLSTIALLATVLLGLPLLAWSAKRRLDEGLVFPKVVFYAQSALLQFILFVWAGAVAYNEELDLATRPAVTLPDVGWGALLLSVALVAMRFSWIFADEATRQRLLMIVPSTGNERLAWVGVSAAAALGEELVFRGVIVALLSNLLGDWLIAAVVTALVFGLAHLVQGWVNSLHVALFGFGFHMLVLATGDLWMAIAVHFVYDVVTGFYLGSRTRP